LICFKKVFSKTAASKSASVFFIANILEKNQKITTSKIQKSKPLVIKIAEQKTLFRFAQKRRFQNLKTDFFLQKNYIINSCPSVRRGFSTGYDEFLFGD
jgi:hypothetical protein